jgi:hypothetical protein
MDATNSPMAVASEKGVIVVADNQKRTVSVFGEDGKQTNLCLIRSWTCNVISLAMTGMYSLPETAA